MYIGKEPIVGNFQVCDTISTSATATFNLLVSSVAVFPETENNVICSLNGVVQKPGSGGGFTISGSTIVFNSALTSADVIDFVILLGSVLNVGTVSDDTITLAKMAGGTDGNVISYDASGNPVAIATGSDGQVLTSTGAGSPPAFEAAAAGGKIGQVVSATKTDYFATTSATLVNVTGVVAAITPSATSSKIWIMITGTAGKDNTGNFHLSIARDGTEIMSPVVDSEHPNTNYDYYFTMSYLDSPSSTSELSYTLQAKQDNGTTTINSRSGSPANRGETTITLMEVLA